MTALSIPSRFSLPFAMRTGVALALSLALGACGGGGGSAGTDGGTNSKGTWTYMVYIAGDNNLSNMAGLDIDEIAEANSNDSVRVPVLLDQSRSYTASASSTTLRGVVTKGNKQLTTVGSNLDLSKKQTLTDFITWAKQNYPADNYGLVLWSHGGGWKVDKATRGALVDGNTGGGATMSVKDIAAGIKAAGGVDLLNFDACLMGMVEVAYEMKDAAKVMVASEESIPGLGNPYTAVLNHLNANPGQDAATLGKAIVADYDAYYRARNRDSVQIAAIDLTKINTLQQKTQETAALLKAELGTTGRRQIITEARDGTPNYDYASNRDLAVFADRLTASSTLSSNLRAKSNELAAAARAAVLSNKSYYSGTGKASIANSTGLAVFLPKASETTSSERSTYADALSSNASAAAGGATWSSFVDVLTTGDTSGTTGLDQTTGGFSYYITWDNIAVDLDLRVNEPSGAWAGPVQGTTSANGLSSGDSWDSGLAFESYTANEALDKGLYDVLVEYTGCHYNQSNCGPTTVTVYRYNPGTPNFDTDFVSIGSRVMSAQSPLPDNLSWEVATWTNFLGAVGTNNYSDWFWPSQVTRALQSSTKTNIPSIKASRKAGRTVSK